MVCSSCGYENPREHRYCGMCGTPFPHRPLTVPDAQSTLSFRSAPLEVTLAPLPVHAVETPPAVPAPSIEPPELSPLETQPIEPAAEHAAPDREESTEIAPAAAPAIDVQPVSPPAQSWVIEPPSVVEAAAPPQPSAEAAEPAPVLHREEPALVAEESAPEAPHIAEAPPVVEPAPMAEAAQPAPAPPVTSVEAAEPAPVLRHKEPAPVAEEPVPPPPRKAEPAPIGTVVEPPPVEERAPIAEESVSEVVRAAESASGEPVVEPPPPFAEEPAPPLIVAEPAGQAAELPHDEATLRTPEISQPGPPAPQFEVTPRPRIVPKPVPPRRETPPARPVSTPHKPAVAHPSPDSLPITPPPASAGMPTFQSVAEAAGPPAISTFEPPAEKHTDQDRELQEFVANFRYTPPDETVDELTMRSEVPIIDKEAPAEFHHASFDSDEPPPPEAGAHPTGKDYYPPTAGLADRSRFLEMSDVRKPAPDRKSADAPSTSFLGLDESPPAVRPLAEPGPPAGGHWLMWSSLLGLLVIFGGLGFLEGRAQITHAFRGPIEVVHDQYEKLRQRMSQMSAPAPAATPAPHSENQTPPPSEPALANQTPAGNPQPDNSAQAASSAPPITAPANSVGQPQQVPPVTQQTTPATGNNSAAPTSETAKAGPPEPIEAPPPKPATKPQPGQQELAKAMDASDPAAAAAWLWKATSRGNPEAPVRLADMYIKGKGVPHSCEQALVLLRSAAVKQNAPARNRLAALYANGTCVPRDPVKAYQLMSSALEADPTSDWAEQNRRDLWNRMTPEERAEAQKDH